MILVVGATGQLGGLIARTLLDRGDPVRVLVRGSVADHPFVDSGAEVVEGDLKDPASLRSACAGVEAVVTTANAVNRQPPDTVESVDAQGNLDLIDVAVGAGVERFVLTSALGAHVDSPIPFMRAKGAAAEHLQATSLAWTILEPNLFMEVWVAAVLGPALGGGPVTVVGEGRRRHSFVAVRDVAQYAVGALHRPEAARRTLLIGGPEALSWRDVVRVFEREAGREVDLRSVAPGEPVPGLPQLMAELLAGLDTYDSPVDIGPLSDEFGVTPTPLAEFVRDLVRV